MEELDIKDDELRHEGFIDGKKVCDFVYFEDKNGNYWLNSANVEIEFQRKGIGTAMIKQAVEWYGAIYFSKAQRYYHDRFQGDTRYLSTEGAALANSCLRKGIINEEWFFDPSI